MLVEFKKAKFNTFIELIPIYIYIYIYIYLTHLELIPTYIIDLRFKSEEKWLPCVTTTNAGYVSTDTQISDWFYR